MIYRTRTYIAADWEHDIDAVNKLYEWNNSDDYWDFSFPNAHELSECRSDETYNCNIKRNCSQNLRHSKNFVLIIGEDTNSLRSGFCMYCKKFKQGCPYVRKENKSYIEFECDNAISNELPIIVLYNSWKVDFSLCVESVLYRSRCHVPMKKHVGYNAGIHYWEWDYEMVKFAFDKLNEK